MIYVPCGYKINNNYADTKKFEKYYTYSVPILIFNSHVENFMYGYYIW
jgi:hypothetical protein